MAKEFPVQEKKKKMILELILASWPFVLGEIF